MKNKLINARDEVVDEATFCIFLRLLAEDRQEEKDHEAMHGRKKWSEGINGWQNTDLADYLFTADAWAEMSKEGMQFYKKPENPWRRVADILYAAKIYE